MWGGGCEVALSDGEVWLAIKRLRLARSKPERQRRHPGPQVHSGRSFAGNTSRTPESKQERARACERERTASASENSID